jgi:hypothetical protein
MKLVRNGPYVAGRIYSAFGFPMAEVNGVSAGVHQVWVSGEFITEDEYNRLMANPPDDPMTPHDPRTTPPAF